MEDVKYEDRIIAFIDILGFSNIIKTTLSSQSQLENLFSALSYIRDYCKSLKEKYEDSSILQLSQFSDTIVISISMKHSAEMVTIFKHLKTIQINLLFEGILLRGGIVKGKIIHTEELLIGPGMISAHDLESKCALHPRIVIDPKVLWQFSRTNGKKHLERLKDFEYEKSFAKEGEGVSYIDYFNDVLRYLPVGKKADDYFRLLCEVIAKNIDNEDISIRIKYIWMREKLKNCEYFEKYKTIFKGIVSNRKKKKQ